MEKQTKMTLSGLIVTVIVISFVISTVQVFAHEIKSPTDSAKQAPFDITKANVTTNGHLTTFILEVVDVAGRQLPVETGKLEGAKVDAYVWPTMVRPDIPIG